MAQDWPAAAGVVEADPHLPARIDWAVTFKPSRKAHTEVLALIVNVPPGTKGTEVEAALQAWTRWPQWRDRLGLGSTNVLRRSKRHDAVIGRQGNPPTTLTWAELMPDERKVQIKPDGQLYSAMRAAARQEGLSLAGWVILACEAAIARAGELQEVPE